MIVFCALAYLYNHIKIRFVLSPQIRISYVTICLQLFFSLILFSIRVLFKSSAATTLLSKSAQWDSAHCTLFRNNYLLHTTIVEH